MSLTPGTKLGPYEIQDAIGAGGMGEVYRARDTRLERSVAIKILPSHLSDNPKLKQRFEREAKAISSLSHPNIYALYDVGNENGIDFLVMEYLEGETLGQRLGREQISPEDILRFGAQIAEALDRAHRNGVVHRDLKPANIMLTREGVKLLDFGLAKTETKEKSEVSGSLPGFTSLPTQELPTQEKDATPLTQEGSILGTFQYMAPEQLEGKEADARSDIFAMGAVLYEMATGKKAFEGDSQASLIAAIMSSQPRPISELSPMSPPALDYLIKACLTKDPEERIQTAHDVKLHLGWIGEGSQLGTPAPVAARRKTRSRLAWGLVGILLLVSVALTKELLDQPGASNRVQRLSILPPEGVTLGMEPPECVISPDGSMAVFTCIDSLGTRQLWLRRFDSLRSEILPGTEFPLAPFWSPDSRFIGFFSDYEHHLKKIDLTDHSVQIICDATSGRGGTWNEDGTILFCPASSGPLYRVSASGGEPFQVTHLDTASGESAQRFPQFLPDGKTFIYVSLPGTGTWETRIAHLENPEPRTLFAAHSGAIFAEPGYLLYQKDGTLFAQKLDTNSLELVGDPLSLPDHPGGYRNYNGSTELSASRNGRLFFPQNEFKTSQAVWFDRRGVRSGEVPLPKDNYTTLELSPDGTQLAVSRGAGWFVEAWVMNLARGILTRLTFERKYSYGPIWSPDGSEVVFSSGENDGRQNIFRKSSSGGGNAEKLTNFPEPFSEVTDWSQDGEIVVIRRLLKETGNDIYLLSMKTGETVPYLNTRFNERAGRISPDGKWLAYRSNESGREELYVQSFPEPGVKIRVSISGASGSIGTGATPFMWTQDGNELIFVSSDRYTVKSASVEYAPEFRTETPKTLFRLPQNHAGYTTQDGKKFLVLVRGEGEVAPNLTVVFNWTEELKGR